jgi:hypothetical protein
VSGDTKNHDVPVSIVAADPTVFSAISGWRWQSGLNPSPTAPVWPMEQFRNRFLTSFGPAAGHQGT